MGQLEKYGLYVMCLVIFLILGVTLWGEPASAQRAAAGVAAINADDGPARADVEEASFSPRTSSLDKLLGPDERPSRAPTRASELSSLLADPPATPPAPVVEPAPAPKVDPAPAPKPAPVAKRVRYTVKRGDSLSLIAQKQCGTVKMKGKILALNPKIKDENDIREGQELILPVGDGAGAVGAKSANKVVASGAYRDHKVRKGENMESIARKMLGSTARWKEIRKMNPNVDPHRMRIGSTLKIPLN
ncbi:MAG: LysM domain-containing protein [Planctomycetota bacterium]|nr:LysM domain-containing protein [Planctomycetota bacterium]